jgi:site-specific recombinase XerD
MTVEALSGWFGAWLVEEGYKGQTIRSRLAYLSRFWEYLGQEGVVDTEGLSRDVLEGYGRWLRERISERTREGYKATTIRGHLSVVRVLLRALYEADILDEFIVPPRSIYRCSPALITLLSEGDVSFLLESIEERSEVGQRDRALFELIYGSGLRASEASRLKWEEVNLEGRHALIKQSKFDKDRVVPLTHETVEMLKRYRLTQGEGIAFVFPGAQERGLSVPTINKRFKALCRKVGLYKKGITTHQLRHACATHLIAHGANIRFVQGLLGHESIQTTVRYTRDLVDEIQKAYRRYHPRENVLYEVAGEGYEGRIAELCARIRETRAKTLAKKQRRGLH